MRNVSIWKIDNNLEEVKELVKYNYNSTFKILKDLDIDDNEKIRKCCWQSIGEIINKEVGQVNVRTLRCNAYIEYPKISEKHWINENGTILPKNIRVMPEISFITFIEIHNKLYCIVEGVKANESRIRANLMRTKKDNSDLIKWGNVTYENVIGYNFTKDFYYWIIINNNKEITIDGHKIKFEEVKGFKSNAERGEIDYSGSGESIDKEIPLMALISMNERFISLHIVIVVDDIYNYKFSLDNNGRLNIDIIGCTIYSKETQTFDFMKQSSVIADIYFKLIPLLNDKYEECLKENWAEDKLEFKKELCIKIIYKLLEENNLSVKDICIEDKLKDVLNNNIESKEIAVENISS
ncbi:hypothetical protein [Clostridium ihumii]|uniref:hypothetical protein n=1 Tax=Clostridium ihumii TaxID=1470356 RepID=UPI003D348598